MRPSKVNVCGIDYNILYLDKPSEVDVLRRESLWGQIDFWTRTIRIFDDGNRPDQDVWQTILHEVLHSIANDLHLECFKIEGGDNDKHDELDIVALALTDVLFRNGWMKTEPSGGTKRDSK